MPDRIVELEAQLATERAQRQRIAQLLVELARLLTTGGRLPPPEVIRGGR